MATKPTNLASWGTDTNFSSGPESGTAVKVEPSAGAKAQGWVPGQPWRGPRMNWWMNTVFQWVTYLNDLRNSADFLKKSHAWITGTHSFGGAVDLNGAVTCNQNLVLDGSSNEVVYSSPTARAIMIPTQLIRPGLSTSLYTVTGVTFEMNSPSAQYRLGFRLPAGATLTAVILEARHTAAPGTTLSVGVRRMTWNSGSTTTSQDCHVPSFALGAGTANQQVTVTCTQNNTSSGDTWFVVDFTSSDAASGVDPDLIHAVRLNFSDPGPRNF